jgi:hypothetical protein
MHAVVASLVACVSQEHTKYVQEQHRQDDLHTSLLTRVGEYFLLGVGYVYFELTTSKWVSRENFVLKNGEYLSPIQTDWKIFATLDTE